ncbi:hypothetical protein JH06_2896 [Blastocystis sp. subtype 4]|uniref:hypothetical protein n=1 Tax=Blastocystis sp. subtype 4 TaxID=944170 RepID=UPI000711C869|nr:hypothetical protein JH06_2896 [Blastocystis sp. subtype 4]KNB43585.1 hypothetical protein JH06_2896 [Blastocystis sp. subtype 4]|eukprot:XP_014527028.1 hypothetical protein JH06_2896 [Blastocystis sp. subtype 4]
MNIQPNQEELPPEELACCAICNDGEWIEGDPIVFCDGCNIGVHATCYGTPLIHHIPEGDWFCESCLSKQKDCVFLFHFIDLQKCILCGRTGGAMKRTTDFQWAHVNCALWIPEVFFQDPDGRDYIDYFHIPDERWHKRCCFCKSTDGCCMSCSGVKCDCTFHVSCGIEHNVSHRS